MPLYPSSVLFVVSSATRPRGRQAIQTSLSICYRVFFSRVLPFFNALGNWFNYAHDRNELSPSLSPQELNVQELYILQSHHATKLRVLNALGRRDDRSPWWLALRHSLLCTRTAINHPIYPSRVVAPSLCRHAVMAKVTTQQSRLGICLCT